jgi:hypothetical protein
MSRVVDAIRSLTAGIAVGISVTVLLVPGTLQMLRWFQGEATTEQLLRIAAVLGLFLFCVWAIRAPKMYEGLGPVVLLSGVLLVVWAIPALVIYWFLNPATPKRAIQIAALFLSTGVAILYYLKNMEKFPHPDQKVTFFVGVSLTPPTVLEWLLKDPPAGE